VPEALLRVVRRYQAERREDETFYNWARRVPNDELRCTLAEEGTGTPVALSTKPAGEAR
jgi:sulfite reductase beta subunit-like hemoprotein